MQLWSLPIPEWVEQDRDHKPDRCIIPESRIHEAGKGKSVIGTAGRGCAVWRNGARDVVRDVKILVLLGYCMNSVRVCCSGYLGIHTTQVEKGSHKSNIHHL